MSGSFEWLTSTSPDGADLVTCRHALTAVRVVERQAAAWRLAWHARVEALADQTPSIFPEQINAEATGRAVRAGAADTRRVKTLAGSPPIRDLFDKGDVSVEHLDALDQATRSLEPAQRTRLLADPQIAAAAAGSNVDEFRVVLRRRVRQLRDDDGIARFEQQRRDRSFKSWTDHTTGMIMFRGQLDPETGTAFVNRVHLKADELFHRNTPDTCPTDPQARQAHLRALALVALTETTHGHPGVSEVIIVIDADTLTTKQHPPGDTDTRHHNQSDTTNSTDSTDSTDGGQHPPNTDTDDSHTYGDSDTYGDGDGDGDDDSDTYSEDSDSDADSGSDSGRDSDGGQHPRNTDTDDSDSNSAALTTRPADHTGVRLQFDVDLPVETVRRHICTGVITPVIVHNGVVLDVGRTQRLATRAQRRALRVMYPTCAIPHCHTTFDHCQPHHLIWWEHDGPTDLANLLPLCSKHHHLAHEGGWQLHLQPHTRNLTITLPDGAHHSHAPPTARAG